MTIAEALLRLAVARGGTLDELQGDVYLEGLADKREEDVIAACKQLQREERGEFDPVLPTLATIRKRTDMAQNMRLRAQQDEARRALPPPKPDPNNLPISPERWKNFRADVMKNLREKHTMNGGGNG